MTRRYTRYAESPKGTGPETAEALRHLWTRYRESGDPAARVELLNQYLGLVHHAVGGLAVRLPAGLDREDLIGAGTLGLVQALETFDPARGAAFSTFAVPRIRGAILDELRSWDWVPRSTRDRSRRIRDARDRLRHDLGREPEHAEIADSLGIDIDTYWRHAGRAAEPVVLPIDQPSSGGKGGGTLGDVLADDEATGLDHRLETEDTLARLAHGFSALSERDRIVLTLSFYEKLTLQQIGEVLHVSESRVSRVRARALKRLLLELEPEEMAA